MGTDGIDDGVTCWMGTVLFLESASWAGTQGSVPSLGPFSASTEAHRIVGSRAGSQARTHRRQPDQSHPKGWFSSGQEDNVIVPTLSTPLGLCTSWVPGSLEPACHDTHPEEGREKQG